MTHGDRLRRVADLMRAVSSALDPDAVLRQIAVAVLSLRPGLRAAVRLVDEEARGYRLVGTGGEAVGGLPAVIPFGQGLTHAVAESRRSLLVADARVDPRAVLGSWQAASELAVYFGAPIEARGRLLGVLNVNFPAGAPPAEEEQELIELLAAQAAVALDNAWLHEAAMRRERTLGALLRSSRSLMRGRDLESTLGRILEEASAIAGTAHVRVLLRDEAGTLSIAGQRGLA